MGTIMVAGSAHLDILARATCRDDVIDRIGDVSLEVGGTACNIAINLANAGVTPRFVSAMNNSTYTKIIVDYLNNSGVEPNIIYSDDLPNGGFSAHIDTQGEMVSAVSSMPVERITFGREQIVEVMEGAKAVVLDCNLSSVAINVIVALANESNIPVYVAAVSEEKSLRIAAITGRIKGVFLNEKEFRHFCRSILGGKSDPAEVAKFLKSTIVLTKGSAGTTVALPDGTMAHVPAPEISEEGTRLGMGDALAAGLVFFHEIHGIPIVKAVRDSMKMVSWIGKNPNCHPGQSGAFEKAIDRYEQFAGHDALTGILNRHSTEEVIANAIDRRNRGKTKALSVLMVDIDHFKSINDTFGHNVGDKVLANVTTAIKDCLRESDYLGRWGGEEFVVVLPNAHQNDASAVAERIRRSVEENVRQPRVVTVSIGCVELNQEVKVDTHAAVEAADHALYEAKRTGRNKVVCAIPYDIWA